MTEEQFKELMAELKAIKDVLELMDSRVYCLELCIKPRKDGKENALIVTEAAQ